MDHRGWRLLNADHPAIRRPGLRMAVWSLVHGRGLSLHLKLQARGTYGYVIAGLGCGLDGIPAVSVKHSVVEVAYAACSTV